MGSDDCEVDDGGSAEADSSELGDDACVTWGVVSTGTGTGGGGTSSALDVPCPGIRLGTTRNPTIATTATPPTMAGINHDLVADCVSTLAAGAAALGAAGAALGAGAAFGAGAGAAREVPTSAGAAAAARAGARDALPSAGAAAGGFDVVTSMEMLEHVPDPARMTATLARLVRPGGHVFVSTINRNLKSFLMAIVGAEYLLRLIPRGTHEYERLIQPAELAHWARASGLELRELAGIDYNPVTHSASLSRDPSVNYLAHFVRS